MRTCIITLLSVLLCVLLVGVGYIPHDKINWYSDIILNKIEEVLNIKPSFIYEGEDLKLTTNKIYIPLRNNGIYGWLILDKDSDKKPQIQLTSYFSKRPQHTNNNPNLHFIIIKCVRMRIGEEWRQLNSYPIIVFITCIDYLKFRIEALLSIEYDQIMNYDKIYGTDNIIDAIFNNYKSGLLKRNKIPFKALYPDLTTREYFTRYDIDIDCDKNGGMFFYHNTKIANQIIEKYKKYDTLLKVLDRNHKD